MTKTPLNPLGPIRDAAGRFISSLAPSRSKTRPILPSSPPTTQKTVLAIGDLHAPFAHPDALAFLSALKDHYRPTEVLLLGDEIDAHALGRWDKDPNGHSAEDEHSLALEWLHQLYEIFPVAKVCESNHTSRYLKLAYRSGIPERFLRDYADVLEAPTGWQWADQWDFDEFLAEHGESFGGERGAYKAALHNRKSTVIGHIHSHASVSYISGPSGNIFAMNVGCLIDEDRYAFAYARHSKSRPWIGAGMITDAVPSLHPMRCDKKGRWIGEI